MRPSLAVGEKWAPFSLGGLKLCSKWLPGARRRWIRCWRHQTGDWDACKVHANPNCMQDPEKDDVDIRTPPLKLDYDVQKIMWGPGN